MAGGALNLGGPVYGLLSAFSWGTGDFGGGLISRYSSVFLAILASEAIGLFGALVLALASAEPFPAPESVAWTVAAGTAGAIGLGGFYYALSRGTMGVVAPLAALIGAGLPVLVGLVGGETLDGLRLVGILVALSAVLLISLPGGEKTTDDKRRLRIDVRQLPYVLIAGVGFGLFFVFLNNGTTHGETWWPLVNVRFTGMVVTTAALIFVIARTRESSISRRTDVALGLTRLRARALPLGLLGTLFFVAGLGDLGGNAFFVLAVRADALSVAVVLASLYPVVTALLAAVFLHERLRPLQILGVVLASVSVPLLR